MGEVYRATDTKLKRQVAIKVLPPDLVADRDRLARFQREAEVLASLNHPNIAAIYGLEESRGITALVMEFVEGDDLSQRIARGAIPLDEALPVAKQVAASLEAARSRAGSLSQQQPLNRSSLATGEARRFVRLVVKDRVHDPVHRVAAARQHLMPDFMGEG